MNSTMIANSAKARIEPTRTVLMTGATSGFGARTLVQLLDADPSLQAIVLARESDHAHRLQQKLSVGHRLQYVWVDLADIAGVSVACDSVKSLLLERQLTHLVLNAGIQAIGQDQTSRDGLEIAFAVNHLAHFLIVERLKRQLIEGGRIVITASEVHDPEAYCLVGITRAQWQDPLEFADPGRSQMHLDDLVDRGEARYSASKLLNVMMARYWAQELPGISVSAFNPSVTPGTRIARERNFLQRLGWQYIMAPLASMLPGTRSIEESATDLTYLLTRADARAVSGQYVNGRVVEAGSVESRDAAKISRLVEVSRHLLFERSSPCR